MKVIPLSVAFLLGLLCSLSMKQAEVETVVEERIVEVPVEVLVPGQSFVEYIAIDNEEKTAVVEPESKSVSSILDTSTDWIDPNTVPITKDWYIYTGEATVDHLWSHHQVEASQIEGWTEEQMAKLHSYLHNGGGRFWEK